MLAAYNILPFKPNTFHLWKQVMAAARNAQTSSTLKQYHECSQTQKLSLITNVQFYCYFLPWATSYYYPSEHSKKMGQCTMQTHVLLISMTPQLPSVKHPHTWKQAHCQLMENILTHPSQSLEKNCFTLSAQTRRSTVGAHRAFDAETIYAHKKTKTMHCDLVPQSKHQQHLKQTIYTQENKNTANKLCSHW